MKNKNEMTERTKVKWNINQMAGAFFYLLSFGISLFLIRSCFSRDIWYDEIYSVGMLPFSCKEIIALTAKDVHPPLYYLYLKGITSVLSLFFDNLSVVVLCKLASLLPYIGIFVFSFTYIRKKMGIAVSGFFMFLLLAMPQMSAHALEIRMYSFTVFLVLGAFLHAHSIISGMERHDEKNRVESEADAVKKSERTRDRREVYDFICLFLYGIATAYTHYFACIAIVVLYFLLLFFVRKQKKERRMWFFAVVASIISYLIWIPFLIGQVMEVRGKYWILPFTFRSIFGCLKFCFKATDGSTILCYGFAVLCILSLIMAMTFEVKKKHTKAFSFLMLSGIVIPAVMILTGLCSSLLGRPIFVYRYLIPALGISWLMAAVLLLGHRSACLTVFFCMVFLVNGYLSISGTIVEENKKIREMEHTEECMEQIPKQAVIISNFDHVQAVVSFYLQNESYLYENEPDPILQSMFSNCKGSCDEQQMKEMLYNNKQVYFLGSFNVREEIVNKWKQNGFKVTEENSCLLERYWFNIYKVELEK